jgi:tetratricopeptide (TPR) repeat protein
MNADGAVLTKIPTFADDEPLGLDDFLAALEDAKRKEAEFQAKRAELLAKDDPAAWAEIAKWQVERAEYGAARDLHRRILAREPTLDNWGMLAYLDKMAGDAPAERRTLETMLATFPDHDERIEWRIRLATMDLGTRVKTEEEMDALIGRHVAALRTLLATIEPEGRVPDQAEVRMRIADLLVKKGDFEGSKEPLRWVVERAGDGRHGPAARWALAFAHYQKEELEPAIAILEELIAKHPTSSQARQAKDVLQQLRDERKGP